MLWHIHSRQYIGRRKVYTLVAACRGGRVMTGQYTSKKDRYIFHQDQEMEATVDKVTRERRHAYSRIKDYGEGDIQKQAQKERSIQSFA
jgi:hypothetical protein